MKRTPLQFIDMDKAIVPDEVYLYDIIQEQRLAERNFVSKLSKIVDHYLYQQRDNSGELKRENEVSQERKQ